MPLMQGRVLASGIMVPVNVDADGDLQVDILAALPAGTNLLGDVQARNKGWVSAAWQKDPLRIGYSGVIRGFFSNTALAAGTNNIDGTAVPAGEIWRLDNISVSYIGTVTNVRLYAILLSSAVEYLLYEQQPPVSIQEYDRQGNWILEPGEKIRLKVVGATLNDDAFLQYVGMRIDIDQ